jgi:hypothetical protein
MALSDYRRVEGLLRNSIDQLITAQLYIGRERPASELKAMLREGGKAFDELVDAIEHLPLDAHTLVHLFVKVLRERLDATTDLADAARAEGDSVIRIPRSRDRISGIPK